MAPERWVEWKENAKTLLNVAQRIELQRMRLRTMAEQDLSRASDADIKALSLRADICSDNIAEINKEMAKEQKWTHKMMFVLKELEKETDELEVAVQKASLERKS